MVNVAPQRSVSLKSQMLPANNDAEADRQLTAGGSGRWKMAQPALSRALLFKHALFLCQKSQTLGFLTLTRQMQITFVTGI